MNIFFEWSRCIDGYQIQTDKINPETQIIIPKSNIYNKFNPLDSHSALLMQLAGIQTKRGFIQFANHNGLLFSQQKDTESVEAWKLYTKQMNEAKEALRIENWDCLIHYFNLNKLNLVNIYIDSSDNLLNIKITPQTLLQAIWWQFLETVSDGKNLEICTFCSTWFTVGPGTGRRKRRQNTRYSFCSPHHQGQFAYLKQKEK